MKISILTVLALTGGLAMTPAFAGDSDAIIGGGLGGAVGAAVGQNMNGRNGAIVGAAIGGAAGAAIGTGSQRHRSQPVVVQTVRPQPVTRQVIYVQEDRHDHGRHRGWEHHREHDQDREYDRDREHGHHDREDDHDHEHGHHDRGD